MKINPWIYFKALQPLACVLVLLFSVSITVNAESKQKPNTEHRPTVVALSPHLVELLFAIGAGDQIIGASEFSDFPQQAKAIPRVGNYLNLQLEKIVALQPDYIFAWQSGVPVDDINRLKQLGFTIVYSNPKTFEDIATEITQFAKLLHHQNEAKTVVDAYLKKINATKKQYQHKKKLLGFYELWHDPLATIAKNSWPQQYLDICGVNNPFYMLPKAYPQISIEQVIAKPIEVIISPTSLKQPDKQVSAWQQWPFLPAVKNNQFIYPNSDKMHRMTLRAADELSKFCKDVDQVRTFYLNQQ